MVIEHIEMHAASHMGVCWCRRLGEADAADSDDHVCFLAVVCSFNPAWDFGDQGELSNRDTHFANPKSSNMRHANPHHQERAQWVEPNNNMSVAC